MRRGGVLGHPEAQRKLTARQKEKQEVAKKDLQAVMAIPAGRRFMWRLIDGVAGVFSGTFTGSSQTFYLEGRRSVGIDVMREVQTAASADYVRMLSEAQSSQDVDQRHQDAAQVSASAETDDDG